MFYSSYDSISQTLYTFSTHPMIKSLNLSAHFLNPSPPLEYLQERKRENVLPNFGLYKKKSSFE